MTTEPSSFRDPAGHLFWHEDILYRLITPEYLPTYNAIKNSGLFADLIAEKKMVSFQEEPRLKSVSSDVRSPLTIKPEIIPFISYPYEWSFSQLKDAALLTLELQIEALKKNFLLKDATAYNIQFLHGQPIFIDHLSFDKCDNYPIWPAYGQFCRHFLAPLVLMSKVDSGFNALLKIHIDGIPLEFVCKCIPTRKLLSFGLFIHLFTHAKAQKKHAKNDSSIKHTESLSTKQLTNLAISLKQTIEKLTWKTEGTEWGDYYKDTNYSAEAMNDKMQIVKHFTQMIPETNTIWDLGGNTGEFSRTVQEYAEHIVCFDIDMMAVETNYLRVKKNHDTKILPLVMNFTNPSSAIGFASQERASLSSRGRADVSIVLALVHHLAISNNIPLPILAKYLSSITKFLIIEFVPKEDSQVKRLLKSRHDIFTKYDIKYFQEDFSNYFKIIDSRAVVESNRTIFLMKNIV